MLMASVAYAADGDVTVDGNFGIGTGSTPPAYPLQINFNNPAASFSGMVATNINPAGKVLFTAKNDQGFWGSVGVFGSGFPATDLANAATMTGSGAVVLMSNSQLGSGGSDPISFRVGGYGPGNERVRITSQGYVGIGTTAPGYQLHLSADSAAKPGTATWTVASDARLKTDIYPYSKGLADILRLNPISYRYNGNGGIGHEKVRFTDLETGLTVVTDIVDTTLLSKTFVGLIAQDVQPVVPEAVSSHKARLYSDDKFDTELLDVNPHALTFMLINAVKELKTQVDALNQQIMALKAGIK
jgi:hypothetical protein